MIREMNTVQWIQKPTRNRACSLLNIVFNNDGSFSDENILRIQWNYRSCSYLIMNQKKPCFSSNVEVQLGVKILFDEKFRLQNSDAFGLEIEVEQIKKQEKIRMIKSAKFARNFVESEKEKWRRLNLDVNRHAEDEPSDRNRRQWSKNWNQNEFRFLVSTIFCWIFRFVFGSIFRRCRLSSGKKCSFSFVLELCKRRSFRASNIFLE